MGAVPILEPPLAMPAVNEMSNAEIADRLKSDVLPLLSGVDARLFVIEAMDRIRRQGSVTPVPQSEIDKVTGKRSD